MAVANALGQRGSKCVKSPMMAWSTVWDDCFRVADHTPGIIAAANGTFVGLRDHDQPAGVDVAFPGILDLGEGKLLPPMPE
jgi:hypothetical protein